MCRAFFNMFRAFSGDNNSMCRPAQLSWSFNIMVRALSRVVNWILTCTFCLTCTFGPCCEHVTNIDWQMIDNIGLGVYTLYQNHPLTRFVFNGPHVYVELLHSQKSGNPRPKARIFNETKDNAPLQDGQFAVQYEVSSNYEPIQYLAILGLCFHIFWLLHGQCFLTWFPFLLSWSITRDTSFHSVPGVKLWSLKSFSRLYFWKASHIQKKLYVQIYDIIPTRLDREMSRLHQGSRNFCTEYRVPSCSVFTVSVFSFVWPVPMGCCL